MEEKFGISTKKFMLEEIKEKFRSFPDFVITNYKGLNAPEIEKLRKGLDGNSCEYFVVKNSVARRAMGDLELGELEQFLNGEIGIGFAGDVIKAARVFANFAKDHKTFRVSCAFIDGKLADLDRVKYLATLPSKEQLLGIVVTYMKSPITGFVGVLNGVLKKLVCAVNEIRKKKEKKKEG